MKLRMATRKTVMTLLGGVASVWFLTAGCTLASEFSYPVAKVSFEDFKALVARVEAHREDRLIDLDTFVEMSAQPDVIILDTRSRFRYERLHVRGARHLNFSDFTQDNLERLIPTFDTTILIYCNNNFEGNQSEFPTKIALAPGSVGETASTQFAIQEKPLMMALNIPTYVNLYGYGYRNVYELHELVDVEDPRIEFAGRLVDGSNTVSSQ